MRVRAWLAAVLLCAACGSPPAPEKTEKPVAAKPADPTGIGRLRAQLPKELRGYEMGALPVPAAPATFWGIAAGATADPEQCGALVAATDAVRGWSASGSGGIVYATAGPAAAPAVELAEDCHAWTLSSGRSLAAVELGDPPQIAGARTIAMTAQITASVENGTQTRSHATTLIAYVNELVVTVTVVTDPGALGPPLPADLPATLLDAAVRSVRGTAAG